MSEPKTVPIEQLDAERAGLRRAAIHLCAMILADASGSQGGGGLSQNGAMLDLETAALRYVRRLDALIDGPDAPSSGDQN